MRYTFNDLFKKLVFLALLSSVQLVCVGVSTARSHEVLPTIADVTVANGTVELFVKINLEAQLAGIDLDTIQDTDNAAETGDYDALRALSSERLTARAADLLEIWNAAPLLKVDGLAVVLQSKNVTVPEGVPAELPRISEWTLSGAVPTGANNMVLAWPDGSGTIVLRQQSVEEPYTGLIEGGQSSPQIALKGGGAQTISQAFLSYIPVGFDHILPKGLDHILFVLGLFFLSTHLRPLVWQVSAFTLAHTVTLALGAMGWVSVPASIVEPLIAASIVYVAVENIFTSGLSPWRPMVIFGFGLLHGLGFASVLGEFGLPEGQFIPALIGFNIGVELGQLTVIAIAFALVGWVNRRHWYQRAIAIPASCVIALVGAKWFVERVFL